MTGQVLHPKWRGNAEWVKVKLQIPSSNLQGNPKRPGSNITRLFCLDLIIKRFTGAWMLEFGGLPFLACNVLTAVGPIKSVLSVSN